MKRNSKVWLIHIKKQSMNISLRKLRDFFIGLTRQRLYIGYYKYIQRTRKPCPKN